MGSPANAVDAASASTTAAADMTGLMMPSLGSPAAILVVHVRLEVILEPDAVDQRQLGFQPVDVLLLVVQDAFEQLAGDVVAHALAMSDRLLVHRPRRVFERQVGTQ